MTLPRFNFCSKILSIILFSMMITFSGLSQSKISSLKKRKTQNQKDIAYTNTLLKNTLKNKQVSLGRLSLLNRKISARKELITSIEDEIDLVGAQINRANTEIQQLEADLLKLKTQYAKIIRYAYRQRNSYEKLMFLLSSKDFNQAYKRYKYLQQISEYSRKQSQAISEKKADLDTKILALKKVKKDKEILLAQKTEENRKLAGEKLEQKAMVQKLQKRESQLRDDLRKQKKYAQKLEKEIQRIIERQARLAKKSSKSKGKYALTPEEKLLSDNFGSNKGKLPWPTKTGFISEKFGEHPHPVLKHVRVRNDGVNITTDQKSECRAVFKGEVTHILSMPGLNNVVIIRHGEYFSVYSNLANVSVKKGDLVAARQSIGIVYTDAAQDETVLKFQLWKGSTKLNPEDWLYRN